MICERCNKEHDGLYKSGRFCSAKCTYGVNAGKRFRKRSPEVGKKISATLIARGGTWSKGLTVQNSEKMRTMAQKVSEALTGRPKSEEHKRNAGNAISIALKKYLQDPESRKKASNNLKKAWQKPDSKLENSRKALLDAAERRRQGMLPSGHLGKKHTEEWKKEASEMRKEWWKDPEYSKKVMTRNDQSEPEREMEQLILNYSLPYQFVGNFGIRIGTRFPDFIHKSEKKIIEVYGDFWHKNDDPQDRINEFARSGYKCLVIWASELKKDKNSVLTRIQEL